MLTRYALESNNHCEICLESHFNCGGTGIDNNWPIDITIYSWYIDIVYTLTSYGDSGYQSRREHKSCNQKKVESLVVCISVAICLLWHQINYIEDG